MRTGARSERFAKLWKEIRSEVDLSDVIIFSGLALVVAGVAQIYVPAAWISAGLGLLYLALKG